MAKTKPFYNHFADESTYQIMIMIMFSAKHWIDKFHLDRSMNDFSLTKSTHIKQLIF